MEVLSLLLAILLIGESSSDRILGMLPITFTCLVLPIIIQVAILLLWAIKWKPPNKEGAQ
ncbi:MAG: hypothetical protein NZ922_04240 [Candidatus Methanomethyliaceae archaeon]|nr:hypothetical protein [Candidatus Methanomethyliaceae archaeon]MDW7971073.1 hypothetical protein [Nitrososphaerota archaeon]